MMWLHGLLPGCCSTLVPCLLSLCGCTLACAFGGQFQFRMQSYDIFLSSIILCTLQLCHTSNVPFFNDNNFPWTTGSTTIFQWLLCVWWLSCSPQGGAVVRRRLRQSQLPLPLPSLLAITALLVLVLLMMRWSHVDKKIVWKKLPLSVGNIENYHWYEWPIIIMVIYFIRLCVLTYIYSGAAKNLDFVLILGFWSMKIA